MAAKYVFDNDFVLLKDDRKLVVTITIKYVQHGVTNLYLDGKPIEEGKVGSFSKEVAGVSGNELKVVTTVADLNANVDNTGLEVSIVGGSEEKRKSYDQMADHKDIVTYHLTYTLF